MDERCSAPSMPRRRRRYAMPTDTPPRRYARRRRHVAMPRMLFDYIDYCQWVIVRLTFHGGNTVQHFLRLSTSHSSCRHIIIFFAATISLRFDAFAAVETPVTTTLSTDTDGYFRQPLRATRRCCRRHAAVATATRLSRRCCLMRLFISRHAAYIIFTDDDAAAIRCFARAPPDAATMRVLRPRRAAALRMSLPRCAFAAAPRLMPAPAPCRRALTRALAATRLIAYMRYRIVAARFQSPCLHTSLILLR